MSFGRRKYRKYDENRKKKQLIINIQNRWNKLEKKRYTTIAEEFHISFLTAKKYVMMSEKEIQSMDSLKKYKKRREECILQASGQYRDSA